MQPGPVKSQSIVVPNTPTMEIIKPAVDAPSRDPIWRKMDEFVYPIQFQQCIWTYLAIIVRG